MAYAILVLREKEHLICQKGEVRWAERDSPQKPILKRTNGGRNETNFNLNSYIPTQCNVHRWDHFDDHHSLLTRVWCWIENKPNVVHCYH